MNFSISKLVSSMRGKPPRLLASSSLWAAGTAELHRRTGRVREAGAFLIGRAGPGGSRIEEFLFYDDVDPTCFRRGIVEFDGCKLGQVWEHCRATGAKVVADVHVHPGGYGQSESDRHNPIIPAVGHIALILPNFAAGRPVPGRIGMYEYAGSRQWFDHSQEGRRFFKVGVWPW